MNFLKAIFSFNGRIGRADFGILTLILLASVAASFIAHAFQLPGRQAIALLLVLSGLVVWLSGAVRRLHDRDKSAWYLLLFFGVPTLVQNFKAGGKEEFTIYFFSGGIGSVLDLMCLAVAIWMIVELGFLPGTPEQNRYGSNPAPLFPE
jgi:uncharacterized membrane protein YhaH (DUF805 family)